MITSATTRIFAACCAFAFVFTGFSYRLVQLQVTDAAELAREAAKTHDMSEKIFARRGAILDINGEPLAQNEPVRKIVADDTLIKDRKLLAEFVSSRIGVAKDVLETAFARQKWSDRQQKSVPDPYVLLKNRAEESVITALNKDIADVEARDQAQKNLPKDQVDQQLRALATCGFRAITFEQEAVRRYPCGATLCHVVGQIDGENKGVDGIEKTMDQYLEGHEGLRFSERDRSGKELVPYRSEERPARDGYNVRLTVDLALQDIVESELDTVVQQCHPKMAIGIMMRPQTGEILALANRPNYDLNHLAGSPMEARRNRAISDQVEPGSTFKIVVASAALQKHLVRPDTMIPVENGYFQFMGKTLRDTHPFAELSVHDILVHSSNIGAAKLGIQLGDQRLFEYVRSFGFGDRTGVQLPGEIPGLVHPVSSWSKLSISRVPMGQEVCVTPLQMATAMCVIANGGSLMMPQIVHDVTDFEGNTVTAFPPVTVRQVISPEIAGEMRDALVDVLGKKGTGKDIHIPGFIAAGKTGTAQKAAANGGGYEKGKYVLSFVGFMPADHPQFVCLVMIDEAQVERSKNYGGTIAGPVFARIADRAARHLGLEPSQELLAAQAKAGSSGEHEAD